MALNTSRWVIGTALACAALAVTQLPPPPQLPREDPELPNPAQRRVEWLRNELRSAQNELRAAQRHQDQAGAVLAAIRASRSPAVLFEIPLPDTTRRAITARVAALWQRLLPYGRAPQVPVGIVIHQFGLLAYALPMATGDRACIVELPLGWELRWITRSREAPRAQQLDPWLAQGLGPCAFYAAFGRPGPYVERWLLSRSFDLAWVADWTAAPPSLRDDLVPLPQFLIGTIVVQDPRYGASHDAVACNAGVLARCRAALFTTPPPPTLWRWRSRTPGVVSRPAWWSASSLHHGDRYLADLMRSMGGERFAAFWTSPEPVESAFRTAMGQPIEVYTAAWQRDRMGALRIGSSIRAASVIVGLLLAALFVGAGASLAGRRQVG